MGKIIAFMNNKGGVLKTTTTSNIAGVLVKKNKKVLLVDADPQGNLATSFGINPENLKNTLTEVIIDNVDVKEAIQPNIVPNLDLLSANSGLNHFPALAYSGKLQCEDIEKVLQKVLQKVVDQYDYILIDSAPYMDLLTINIIKSSDSIVIPSQMETFAAKGIVKLINDVNELKGNIEWIIPTLFDARTTIHNQMLKQVYEIVENQNIKISKNKITKSIQATNATAYERIPLVLTNSNVKQKQQYFDVVEEMGL